MDVILKQAEAKAYIDSIENDRTRRAVDFGVSLAVRVALKEQNDFARGSNPIPIDLLMYAKVLRAIFDDPERLGRAVAGEPDDWGPA